MLDLTWKLFSQTGNIEAYLLLKELESDPLENHLTETEANVEMSLETKM